MTLEIKHCTRLEVNIDGQHEETTITTSGRKYFVCKKGVAFRASVDYALNGNRKVACGTP